MICKKEESADSDIVLSAALLRDLIVYAKRSSKTLNSTDDSAEIAQKYYLNTTLILQKK